MNHEEISTDQKKIEVPGETAVYELSSVLLLPQSMGRLESRDVNVFTFQGPTVPVLGGLFHFSPNYLIFHA